LVENNFGYPWPLRLPRCVDSSQNPTPRGGNPNTSNAGNEYRDRNDANDWGQRFEILAKSKEFWAVNIPIKAVEYRMALTGTHVESRALKVCCGTPWP